MQTQSHPGAIVHVVQHLRPGGLEVMALELARMQSEQRETLVVSLEGDADAAIAAWPRLADQRHRLIFLGKRPGLDGAAAAGIRGPSERRSSSAAAELLLLRCVAASIAERSHRGGWREEGR